MVYVLKQGPKILGVFECVSHSVEKFSELIKYPVKDIGQINSYSGDLLLTINGYPQARLIKTIFY